MPSIDELIRRTEANGHEVWIGGPVPEDAIARLEAALGVDLPPSYRRFVASYGRVLIHDSAVAGIVDGDPVALEAGSLYGETSRFRQDFDLPARYLVIQADEDAPDCLDASVVSADGEMQVVCFDLHARCATRIASTFTEWLATHYFHWADEGADEG